MLKVGDRAPEFTLLDENENKISLSSYLGRKVVLWFFPKANTPGWTIEGKGFRDEFQQYEEKTIQILGCSADSPQKQKKFSYKKNFQSPLLSDESHEVLKSYGVWGKKKFMGREYMGISRVTYIINENGIIDKVYEKVSVKSHAKDILNELEWLTKNY